MIRYIAILFLLSLFSLYPQGSNQTVSEYNYIFDKDNAFTLESTNNAEISFMIERRGLPLVNRLVRFESLTPDLFTFENEAYEAVVPTDENGVASVNIDLLRQGRGIVAVHMLYITSTGATNISHEEFLNINIKPKGYFEETPNGTIDTKVSAIISTVIVPYLFIATIAIFLISYFKYICKECHSIKSIVFIATLFGFSSIKKRFDLMLIFVALELLAAGYFIISNSFLTPVILVALSLSSFPIKRNRAYSIGFFLFALLSITHVTLHSFIINTGILITPKIAFSTNFIFLFFVFLFITAFLSNTYIPIALLTLYSIIFPVGTITIIFSLFAIFVASVLYIVKSKYADDMPVFYVINLLKMEN